jgi:hypothetical protein
MLAGSRDNNVANRASSRMSHVLLLATESLPTHRNPASINFANGARRGPTSHSTSDSAPPLRLSSQRLDVASSTGCSGQQRLRVEHAELLQILNCRKPGASTRSTRARPSQTTHNLHATTVFSFRLSRVHHQRQLSDSPTRDQSRAAAANRVRRVRRNAGSHELVLNSRSSSNFVFSFSKFSRTSAIWSKRFLVNNAAQADVLQRLHTHHRRVARVANARDPARTASHAPHVAETRMSSASSVRDARRQLSQPGKKVRSLVFEIAAQRVSSR